MKDLKINESKEYTTGNISFSILPKNKVHIMTSKYGEVTSASLNKTQIKRVINWLQNWIKEQEKNNERTKNT